MKELLPCLISYLSISRRALYKQLMLGILVKLVLLEMLLVGEMPLGSYTLLQLRNKVDTPPD